MLDGAEALAAVFLRNVQRGDAQFGGERLPDRRIVASLALHRLAHGGGRRFRFEEAAEDGAKLLLFG